MSENLIKLKDELKRICNNNKLCIALSDGVDSTVLLKVSLDAGLDVLAVSIDTNFFNNEIRNYIRETSKLFKTQVDIIKINMFEDERINNNDINRCYHCKSRMFKEIKSYANIKGYDIVCDGTNFDDLNKNRPGLKAKEENNILSPYANCCLTKDDVRNIGRELGLKVAEKPSNSCVLTRFNQDVEISDKMINRVYKGEKILHKLGFNNVRLRVNGDDVKIQVLKNDKSKFLDNIEKINDNLKEIGYKNVELHEQELISN